MTVMLLLLVTCVLGVSGAAEMGQMQAGVQMPPYLAQMYRRVLHALDPRQLQLQDALHMQYKNGMMAGPTSKSLAKGIFEGEERPTFTYLTSLVNPEQKRVADGGCTWLKQNGGDTIFAYHYGSPMKIHTITSAGVHQEVILGNPLHMKHAQFIAVVPRATYFILESVSEDEANFHSYISVPGWRQRASEHFCNAEMVFLFPEHRRLIYELAQPGIRHRKRHDARGRRRH